MIDWSLIGLAISGGLNVALVVLYYRRSKKKQAPADSASKHLLKQLMSSGAVLKIEVLDPSDFFLLSPRGRG